MSQTVTPQFRIIERQRSISFYVDGLGFHIDWEHRFEPGLPVFMQLTREGQTIFLTEHAGDCKVGGSAYFVVPDVDACYEEFLSRGVQPTEPPEDTPWGSREMVMTDPDGNRLRFATRIADQNSVGRFVIAAYRPKAGREDALDAAVKKHARVLRGEKLITERPPYVMRGADGTIVEVFEWRSAEAIEQAHSNPSVGEIWAEFNDVCDYVKLADLAEAQEMFAEFEAAPIAEIRKKSGTPDQS